MPAKGLSMNIQELVDESYKIAKDHGWWEKLDTNPLEKHMLMVSEISEATEEARAGTPPIYQWHKVGSSGEPFAKMDMVTPHMREWDQSGKPEGELIELADCVIRIADYCGHKGWDLTNALQTKLSYNRTRPYKHGNKLF